MVDTNILISGLRSRRIRSRVLGRGVTARTIGFPQEQEEGGLLVTARNFLGGLVKGTVKVGGWLFKGIVGLGFSAVAVVQTLHQTFDFVMRFNWNVTDAELDRSFRSFVTRFSGQIGGTLGNLMGYVVCGIGVSSGIMVINEPLALYLLKEVGEETLDEFLTNLRFLIRTAFFGLVQLAAINAYKNVRRTAKRIFKDPNSGQSKLARKIFGDNITTAIQQWGEEGTKPWSFNIAKEKKIEEIKNPLIQEFVEEFVDEFGDACWDSFYIIAQGIDTWVLEQRMGSDQQQGEENSYEITLNRQAEDERIIISGNEQEVRTQALTVMNNYSLIENRDVGMWVGEPLRHDMRRKQGGISLRVQLFNWPSPPFFRSNELQQRVMITIPGIKRSKLDWETIKLAVGGKAGYLWGRWLATANLVDDDERFAGQMQVYGGSESQAERRLKACLELSDYKIKTLSITEEKREGIRASNRQQYKRTTRVYPAHCTILNAQKVIREDQGDATLQGTYNRTSDKILLWVDDKPSNFEATIQRLLRTTPN